MPVTVTFGTVPEGLNVGPPQAEPSSVTVRGASSRVESVSAVVARVAIDASALNIDREIELIPVDAIGNQVTNVEVDPQRARVRIAVARQLATRTLPVVPQLFGTLAPGYRISSVTVEPLVLTVSGEESIVTRLESAPTQAIDIDGRTTDLEAMVGLALPEGVSVVGSDQVRVILTVAQEDATMTLLLGVGISGTQCACIYDFNTTAVSVTLAGPPAELDALDTLSLQVVADVTGLEPGTHSVFLELSIPGTLEVISILPTGLDLFIQAATPLPGPS